jgi:hypothetical protein
MKTRTSFANLFLLFSEVEVSSPAKDASASSSSSVSSSGVATRLGRRPLLDCPAPRPPRGAVPFEVDRLLLTRREDVTDAS